MTDFSDTLIDWQRKHGRNNLAWQTNDPYRVWLSEIMLQQTQVATVAAYYPRFLAAFASVGDLAAAHEDEVLRLWAGLGYYSRARNLHAAARQVVAQFGGVFPSRREDLQTLKGVGRSTAAAVAAFAFGRREAILDGNVKRVLCRVFALDGDPADKAFERDLWQLAESLLPEHSSQMRRYTQGLMDLGALVCARSKPRCAACPMQPRCRAFAENRTHELPRRKTPPKVVPVTQYWLLLQRADGALLLHKRAPRGIWAGMYCVPLFDDLAALTAFAGCGEIQALPPFVHRLTHRQLQIFPYRITGFDGSVSGSLSGAQWLPPAQWHSVALPKPLSQLLQNLCTASVDNLPDLAARADKNAVKS